MDRGRTLNPDFVDYRMPLATEAPDIRVAHIITDDPDGPFGAKEASEGAIVARRRRSSRRSTTRSACGSPRCR